MDQHLREHLYKFLLFRLRHALDYVVSVLGKEEEATASTPFGVLLALVSLEDLESVVDRVDRLLDGGFIDSADLSDLAEHFGGVGVYNNVLVDFVKLL